MSSPILPDSLIGVVPAPGAVDHFVLRGGKTSPTIGPDFDPTWGPNPLGYENLMRRQWAVQQGPMNGTAFVTEGTTAPTVTTPGAAAGSVFGGGGSAILLTSTAAIASEAGLTGVGLQVRPDHNPLFGARWGPGGVITTARWWVGLFNGDPMASATPAVSFAGFRYDTSTGDTTIKAMVGNGIGVSVVGQTSMISGAGAYTKELWMRFNNAGTTIEFWDGLTHLGTAQSGVTANFPATNVNLGFYARVRALAAASRTIAISRIAGTQL